MAQGDSAQYLPTGHLVFARAGALYAMRFDAARLAVTGAPVKVADAVITHPESGGAQVAISRTGTLVYAAGGSRTAERPLLWVDRSGAARPVTDRQASFWWPRISPDGRRIAVVIDAAFSKIWVLDVERGTFTRASQLAGDQDRAAWMPDGVHVTFGADTTGSGAIRLFSDRIDGTGSATLLFDGSGSASPLGWSPDGRRLLYRQIGATTGQDVWVYSADDRTSTPFLQSPSNESSATFSPDGRWVAYVSDESGAARGVRATVPRARHPESGFDRRRHGSSVVARRARAVLCEGGHAVRDAGQPRRNVHQRRGPASVLGTVQLRRGHRELRRGP